MKAAIYENTLKLQNLPSPVRNHREALIRVTMAGICNTDIEIVKGYLGFKGILGHEFAGVVEDADDDSWITKRVVGEINSGCGSCDYCLKGLQRHCPNRTTLGIFKKDGAFAEKLTLPVENLLEIPDSVTDQAAVFTEPLAAALEILEQLHIIPAARIAIIGDGKLGLLISQVMQLAGCEVHLFGKIATKLEIAEHWGIHTHPADETHHGLFPIVIEASGNPSGFKSALNMVEPRGTIVMKSTYHGSLTFNAAKIVIDEITILGSRCGRFKPALHLLEKNIIHTEPLISRIFSFDELESAFQYAQKDTVLKVLLKFAV